ncbi:MAG: Stage V sporulation protein E [Candidatus Jorgensenbacteria bacterium GW2011_GWA1_48_13]|uniref:Probable peptidoglycan glycosyltransferase FtsW n=1 Tax=Candidatus Jorgensenbacteria bacterium GW2011_GWB1_50_10 TaxID=1618665 RepID=A0A0G1Z7W6_9BACT|nr:MAG: Stage V sporulation protein E [Candidatus Jorgensenbacteria bacterium GW2011_GWA1_48_13]KKW15074.1 MAG: Stage V sporulation protein E [Candidatus Jorgensenbacteria bacterium GW2011_GWB1_50_10]
MRAPKSTSSPDYVIVGLVVILTIFGLVMLASASSDLARDRFSNSFHYLNNQLLHGLVLGAVGFLFGFFTYYRRWEKMALPLLIITIILMLLIFSPLKFAAKGASRWIDFGVFTVQPAEILKLTFLLYLAAWLSKNEKRSRSVGEGFLPFLILVGIVMALIIIQPSTTTALIIFASSLVTYFAAGARLRFLVGAVLLAALGLSVVVYFTPYRLERILTFINPEANELSSGYHVNQSQMAIGSGGLFGVGYGNSTTKLRYLPEPIGDSIFAVIAEELGFVGGGLLIAAFGVLILRGLALARHAPDSFGRLLVTGFVSLIGIQAFINVASVSGLIPFTGVPLPLISFGGTALAVFLTMSGIIVNVSRYRR